MRRFILSCGFLGFLPGAPGTYATVVAVCVWVLGVWLGAPLWTWIVLGVLSGVLLLVVGVPPADGGGRSDPGWCVLDEVCGTFLAVAGQPMDAPLLTALAALVFFRLFDILKPPPINLLERLPGAWGVLLDDVAAGVLANAVIWGLRGILSLL